MSYRLFLLELSPVSVAVIISLIKIALTTPAGNLKIQFVDVEGGKSSGLTGDLNLPLLQAQLKHTHCQLYGIWSQLRAVQYGLSGGTGNIECGK